MCRPHLTDELGSGSLPDKTYHIRAKINLNLHVADDLQSSVFSKVMRVKSQAGGASVSLSVQRGACVTRPLSLFQIELTATWPSVIAV